MAGTGAFAEIMDGDVYKYYADGEWKKSSSGKSVSIINPSTRKTQYKVQGLSSLWGLVSDIYGVWGACCDGGVGFVVGL